MVCSDTLCGMPQLYGTRGPGEAAQVHLACAVQVQRASTGAWRKKEKHRSCISARALVGCANHAHASKCTRARGHTPAGSARTRRCQLRTGTAGRRHRIPRDVA